MWSLCRTRIQGDNLALCYRAFQQTYPRRALGGWFGAWAYCRWPWRSRLALRMNKPTDTPCLLHPRIESIPQNLESYFQHSYQTHLPSPLCSSRALRPVSHLLETPHLSLHQDRAGRVFFLKCRSGSVPLLLGRLSFNLRTKFKTLQEVYKSLAWILFCNFKGRIFTQEKGGGGNRFSQSLLLHLSLAKF